MMTVKFAEIKTSQPSVEFISSRHDEIYGELKSAVSTEKRMSLVRQWDQLRRKITTWQAMTELKFNQDTTNQSYKAAQDYADEISPKVKEQTVRFQKLLIGEPFRSEVVEFFGEHVIKLWEVNVLTFAPEIASELVDEAKLCSQYNELLSSARIDFQGEQLNLAGITPFVESLDRQTRESADRARWQWFADNRQDLDEIFDRQVKLRNSMAKKLGFKNYVELGYTLMCRIDYDRKDVERFRNEVVEKVVPICSEIRARQETSFGLDAGELRHWDESIFDVKGNPSPQSDYAEIVAAAQAMFDDLGYGLDDFFKMMQASDLMDLQNRKTKAGGGFCTSFDKYGIPYIYANFNGTKGDVEVFTHEMGHAFQCYSSRHQPLQDLIWPTYESCEIHSMGLEFLTYPQMDQFFGDDAERFRQIHLTQSLLFLPYGVAVDHFQHLIYDQPNASTEERHQMWQEMERLYLPWRNYGGTPHVSNGGRWQLQRHIYLSPFYYIDYTLALVCAMQFWTRASKNRTEAMQAYVDLCKRGGEAPFQSLAKSAGLRSPFDSGCLDDVLKQAQQSLSL